MSPRAAQQRGANESTAQTQAERTERSTRQLLDAAGDLIVERGFSNVTLAMIGERAGYSRGLASMRFGTKEQLLAALVERITLRWHHRNVMPQIEGRPALDAILVLIDEIGAQIKREPRGVRVLYTLMFEALAGNPTLRTHFVKWNEQKRLDVEALLNDGLIDGSVVPNIDASAEAALVVAGLRGIAYQWVLDPRGFDPTKPLALLSASTEERLSAALGARHTKRRQHAPN